MEPGTGDRGTSAPRRSNCTGPIGSGDSSINHAFRVWAKTEHFLDLRNSIPVEINEASDERGIGILFPHRSIYTGSVTEPFLVRAEQGHPEPSPGPPPTDDS